MNAFGVRNDGGVEREHRICNGNSAFGNGLLTNLRCEIRPEEGEKRARKRILTELRGEGALDAFNMVNDVYILTPKMRNCSQELHSR